MEKPKPTKHLELPTEVVERAAGLNPDLHHPALALIIEQCQNAMKPNVLPVQIAEQLLDHSKTGDPWPFIEEELVILEDIIAYTRRRRALDERLSRLQGRSSP